MTDQSSQSGSNQQQFYRLSPSAGRKSGGRSIVVIVLFGLIAVGCWYGLRSSSQVPQIAAATTFTSTSAKNPLENSAAINQKFIISQVPVSTTTAPQENDVSLLLPSGSRIILFDPTATSETTINLTKNFSSAGLPNLSFDATTFLFLGRKKSSDPISIWEKSIDGGAARKVTDCEGECLDVLYLSTMYTIDAEKPTDLIAFVSRKNLDTPAQLYTCMMDGGDRRQITFSPGGVSDPFLLSDGRLMITMPTKNGFNTSKSNIDNTSFYVLNTDGTDLFGFAGFHETSAHRSLPVESAEGRVYYLEAESQSDHIRQSIVSVDRKRSLRTRLEEQVVNDGSVYSLSTMPDGNLIVAYQPVSYPEQSSGIYLLENAGDRRFTKYFDDDAWHEWDAQAVFAKSKPPGRSSVVNNITDVGQLYCLDAYLSDDSDEVRTKQNTIQRVRLYSSEISANPVEKMLGDIAVETDGSFYLEIPARTPLRLETLAQSGDVIRSMRNWFWVMPMERRGCIGCHEDRELTPPNRHVNALRKRPHRLGISTSPPMKKYEEGH